MKSVKISSAGNRTIDIANLKWEFSDDIMALIIEKCTHVYYEK